MTHIKIRERDAYENNWNNLESFKYEINKPVAPIEIYAHFQALRRLCHLIGTLEGHRCLSICCGGGMDAQYMSERSASIVGLDISNFLLHAVKKRFSLIQGDIDLVRADAESLPFKNDSFDVVYIYEGLHHLPNPTQAIKEMTRVSREILALVEPNVNSLSSRLVGFFHLKSLEPSGLPMKRLEKKAIVKALRVNSEIKTIKITYGTVVPPIHIQKTAHMTPLVKFVDNLLFKFLPSLGTYLVIVGIKGI